MSPSSGRYNSSPRHNLHALFHRQREKDRYVELATNLAAIMLALIAVAFYWRSF